MGSIWLLKRLNGVNNIFIILIIFQSIVAVSLDLPNITVSFREDVEVGHSITRFQQIHGIVIYSIDPLSDPEKLFSIDQNGIVRINGKLDREKTTKHEVKVIAMDRDAPMKRSTSIITVIVEDVNDNFPTLLEDYHPILQENRPPMEFTNIFATDADDWSLRNGPPFTFAMDPNGSDEIKTSFSIQQDTSGNGSGIVSSLKFFDREETKEWRIPIIIRDSGNPVMSGTSTLTVTIAKLLGDDNDNKMRPGSKDILIYNYKNPDTKIGRIYVEDLDDWDLSDKKFLWKNPDNKSHPMFRLDENTGMITMLKWSNVTSSSSSFQLEFNVFDRLHTQQVEAIVSIKVKHIKREAVINSGSIRIDGITANEFIAINHQEGQIHNRSKTDFLLIKLAKIFETEESNINIFSIQEKQLPPPVVDVRFSVHNSGRYLQPVFLNGIVLLHKSEIEQEVGINITMVGINECFYENTCDGSCSNGLDIGKLPYTIDANATAFVGVRVETFTNCNCRVRDFQAENTTCRNHTCYNGGKCVEGRNGPKCNCPRIHDGPRCQITSRTFKNNDWAWYAPLEICQESHLSLEFITTKDEGLILFNGPIDTPKSNDKYDFISLELEKGQPRLLIGYSSSTVELKIQSEGSLADGEWHRIDILLDSKNVQMILDLCKNTSKYEADNTNSQMHDKRFCQSESRTPPLSNRLKFNTPLQIGGINNALFDPSLFNGKNVPSKKHFDGCIRNFVINSEILDLGHPAHSKHKVTPGCTPLEESCHSRENSPECSDNGVCVGSFKKPRCECKPGWMGPGCTVQTSPTTFLEQSYVQFALLFQPDKFATQIQLKFRTRENFGELLRIQDKNYQTYGILEIYDGHIGFRLNLNSSEIVENSLYLAYVTVNDGQWHSIKVSRYGSIVILQLDEGEGRNYNETFHVSDHQQMKIDKVNGVYAGGYKEQNGNTFSVLGDLKRSCLDDIRLNGKHLPPPPSLIGTQWGQAISLSNVENDCLSDRPCDGSMICQPPFICNDLWNEHECACPKGTRVSGTDCEDIDECTEDSPCDPGCICINLKNEEQYYCDCISTSSNPFDPDSLTPSAITASNSTSPSFIVVFVIAMAFGVLVVLSTFCIQLRSFCKK